MPDVAYGLLKLSQYFESVQSWQESNLYATLALTKKNKKDDDYYLYLFQLAVSLWWIGDGKQARVLLFELAEDYSHLMDEEFKSLLQKNITS
mgnify:FL=1